MKSALPSHFFRKLLRYSWQAPVLRSIVPGEWYLKNEFKIHLGKKLDLKNPQTFNEKLQWLKLYDHNPLYTTLVDKYKVKEYVAQKIGEQYVIPLLGVWDCFDDIDFSKLPEQFVLKCNHDSGNVFVCRDKSSFDYALAKRKLEYSLKRNYYYYGREWPYKNVPRKIIAEKFLVDDKTDYKGLVDYKFFCFNGVVDCVMVCLDRHLNDVKFYFFDKKWNLKRLNKRGKEAPKNFTVPRPLLMDHMFELAAQLSKGIPFVRVDLYESGNQIYFGELTFFPDGGFDNNLLLETDEYFGSLLNLKHRDTFDR